MIMHRKAAAYLSANEQRLRDWQDERLSVDFLPPPPPQPKYRVRLFPPAPLRPWRRPFTKSVRASALPTSSSNAS
jgi:hypothetical protein